MDVILHIGAHRCASTTFQHYLRSNEDKLARMGIGTWGPRRTRNGLFHGIQPGAPVEPGGDAHRRGVGRVRMNLARQQERLKTLVVSDENMMGSVRENLRTANLYGGVGERLARYFEAFEGYVTDVILNIRSPETYWASALGYSVSRGRPVPGQAELSRLASAPRQWRDVVTDVACALPGTRLWVLPFETFAGRPETQLATVAAVDAPKSHSRSRINATPHLEDLRRAASPAGAARLPRGFGRWQPFSTAQIAAMQESYADDVMWLVGGADGLAWMMNDPDKKQVGTNLPLTDKTRGRPNDDQEQRMEGAG